MTSGNKPLIDLGNISNLAVYLKATEKQMLQAYGRALGRMATWLKTHSARMAREGNGIIASVPVSAELEAFR